VEREHGLVDNGSFKFSKAANEKNKNQKEEDRMKKACLLY
jgi:hypothetical protein